MVNIPGNFPKGETEYKYICKETENMGHIYNCEILSERKTQTCEYFIQCFHLWESPGRKKGNNVDKQKPI